jgi:membrane-bound hydrogenase subunit alpha
MKIKRGEGEGIGRHEAPRGEVFHYVKFKAGEEAPVVWKVKAPTYSNLMSWIPMLKGQQIADIPIVAASIDPCVACMDRVLVKDENGDERVWTKQELLKLSQEKSRKVNSSDFRSL